MSQRLSGSVGVIVLGLIAVNAACGSRDNLFVADDDASGGGLGVAGGMHHAGTGHLGSAGRAGMENGGFGAHAGGAGSPARGGGVGVGGFGVAGTVGAGGAAQAFGGSSGFGAVGNVGGGSMDWCVACLLQNNTNPNSCARARCNMQTTRCDLVPVGEGASCAGNPCTTQDQCVLGQCMPGPALSVCRNNDQCCPAGCTASTDNDCALPPATVIAASDRGWYDSTGSHDPGNKNTFTGFNQPNQYNSFFVFDLSGVTGTIVGAQLQLEQDAYYGVDSSETVSVWDVSTNPDVVSSTVLSTAIFMDLQSGTQYSNITGAPTDDGATLIAYLTGTAISDLNAARGHKFAIGLHVGSLSLPTQAVEGLRFSERDEPRPNHLVLTLQGP